MHVVASVVCKGALAKKCNLSLAMSLPEINTSNKIKCITWPDQTEYFLLVSTEVADRQTDSDAYMLTM